MSDALPGGGTGLTAELIERLRDAEARFRLESWRGPDELVAAAVAIAEAGLAGSAVLDLAGDDRAQSEEVLRDLDRSLKELGLEPLLTTDALSREVARRGRKYLAGEIDARSLGESVWMLWQLAGMPDDVLGELELATLVYVEEPEYISEVEYREAVESFVRVWSRERGHAPW